MENSQDIFNYLPIRRNVAENDYIAHLGDSFHLLESAERQLGQDRNGLAILDTSLRMARPFAVMPFHLLFMMAVQYKMLQISMLYKKETDLFFAGVGGRSKGSLLSEKRSVFDMALVNERTMPEIFRLVNLDPETVRKFKNLIDERNDNLAHAKGGIEQEVENKISEYLLVLESIQNCCTNIYQEITSVWLEEVDIEDEMVQFLDARLIKSCISPHDFGVVVGALLESEKLTLEQWTQVIATGLELSYDQTIFELKYIITLDHVNDLKKNEADRILRDNGEVSPLLTPEDI